MALYSGSDLHALAFRFFDSSYGGKAGRGHGIALFI
jgi:hypothetical protein